MTIVGGGTRSIGTWTITREDAFSGAWIIFDYICEALDKAPTSVGVHWVIWSPISLPGISPDGGAFYPVTDTILLGSLAYTVPTIALHEMGHSVQYRLCGNYLPSKGGSHWMTIACDPDLAWVEGWASFWAIWVQQDPRFFYVGGGYFEYEPCSVIFHCSRPWVSGAAFPRFSIKGNYNPEAQEIFPQSLHYRTRVTNNRL